METSSFQAANNKMVSVWMSHSEYHNLRSLAQNLDRSVSATARLIINLRGEELMGVLRRSMEKNAAKSAALQEKTEAEAMTHAAD